MISKETFKFLKELKLHNDKEWFDENRSWYVQCKKEFEQLVEYAIREISIFDKDAAKITAKSAIFRINRDIRFSNDKMPYKTNFGAFIAEGGRKSIKAGYYIHLEPGSCFLSGGIYMPASPVLKALRTEIYENIEEFRSILSDSDFQKNFGKELFGEKLKTAPKGFPRDFSDIDLLKFKHYTVMKNEPDAVYQKPQILQEIKNVFRTLQPFNSFLNKAVNEL